MKLTHEIVTQIGFQKGALNRPNETFYNLDHQGLIILLTHHYLGKPGIADLWALENREVETVADMLAVMYIIGRAEHESSKEYPD